MNKSPFTPNANGLVVVKLKANYGANVAGETAGFLPQIAKQLVQLGYAELPGQGSKAEADDEAEPPALTTRRFRPVARDPLDHDGDGRKGGSLPADQRDDLDPLRDEYHKLTGNKADARWGKARLEAEIAKAKDPAPVPVNG